MYHSWLQTSIEASLNDFHTVADTNVVSESHVIVATEIHISVLQSALVSATVIFTRHITKPCCTANPMLV